MLHKSIRLRKYFPVLFLAAILISAIFITNCSNKEDGVTAPKTTQASNQFNQSADEIQSVITIQNKHTDELMSNPNVVGVGTGLNSQGKPAIVVFSKYEVSDKSKRASILSNVPYTIEGKPVDVVYTGEIKALALTSRVRPVPNGYSIGNNNECAAGTLGCIVTDGTALYILSNNHVLARENNASLGEPIVQPGRYENRRCADNVTTDKIGELADFYRITFSTSASNTIDAALASVTLNNDQYTRSTPSNYYGFPATTPVNASLNLGIKKVGRTTSQTTGTITYVNVTVNVGYSGGTARFINQLYTSSRMCKAGDSGSLVVTNDGLNSPVGLLFAGSSNGNAVLNPIGAVLTYFGVSIVGQ